MKILLAAASFSSELSGVQRHALSLARCLLTRSDVSELHLVIAPWQIELVRNSELEANPRLQIHIALMKHGAFSRNLWYYRRLPRMAAQLGVDLVQLAYPVPVDARRFSCPTVVTLHDLYPYDVPSNFGVPKVVFNRLILQQCLRNVNSIACVSDTTYQRLGLYVSQSIWQKALRIYNCVEPETQDLTRSPIHNWSGGPFLLCVAQHRRNKNIPFLLRVFERLIDRGAIDPSTQLLLIGIEGPETRSIRRVLARSGLSENVPLLEGLSDSELQWCYRNSSALLAPSTIEGFGLPLVEALLAGCPVICSDIPAFREFGVDRCRYVKLDEQAEEGFAKAIVARLREVRGKPITIPLLSAPVIAGQYMHLYRGLLASAKATQTLSFPVPEAAARPERPYL